MMRKGADRWDERYRSATVTARPAQVLLENRHLLPPQGRVLDLACGLGRNSLFLAERGGLRVSAWDFSRVAIDKLRETACARDLDISAEVRDVVADPPPPRSFDVIVVTRFLDRSLVPHLLSALLPGGVIFYQTFLLEAIDKTIGPQDPVFRLARNELLELFRPLCLLFYREEGRVGDISEGFRNEAMLVAWKDPGRHPAAAV